MTDPHRPAPPLPGNGHAAPPPMHPAAPRPLQSPRPAGASVAQPAPALRPSPAPVRPTPSGAVAPGTMPRPVPPAPAPMASARDDDAIALIEEGEDDGDAQSAAPVSKIHFGPDNAARQHKWQRQPTSTGHGAVRVRTFHAKLSDQGLEYLDDAINHWLDAHPDVDVKHITTTTGMFDGKFKDLALIVNVWY